MRSIELFTGAGGLALGMHAAGFKHVALVELNKHAHSTLIENQRRNTIPGIESWDIVHSDVAKIDYSKYANIDVLAGGVPCQPFSGGGKQLGRDDPRNMFPEFIRAVKALRPRAFIIENVKGLMWPNFRDYFKYIQLELTAPLESRKHKEKWQQHKNRLETLLSEANRPSGDLEYNVYAKTLNAADFGVPQRRERVFIVGFRKELNIRWEYPEPTHSLKQLLYDQSSYGSYWRRHGKRAPKLTPHLRTADELAKSTASSWVTVRDVISSMPKPTRKDDGDRFGHVLVDGARAYPGHTGSQLDLPAKTLKAGVHGVPGGENMVVLDDGTVRYFTIREAARLQSFPDDWLFTGSWSEHIRQLGNAVPVELARCVAASVASSLREHNQRDRAA